jgi:hypothetical protein
MKEAEEREDENNSADESLSLT